MNNNKNNNEMTIHSSDCSIMEENIQLIETPAEVDAVSVASNTYSGIYKLKNKSSGMCLTVNTDDLTEPKIVTDNDKESPNQWFKITHLGNGQHSIRPLHKTNLVLTVTKEKSSSDYQLKALDNPCDVPASLAVGSMWTFDADGIIRNAQYNNAVLATTACAHCEFGDGTATSCCPCYGSQKWDMIKLSLTGNINITVPKDSIQVGGSVRLIGKTSSGGSVSWSSSNTFIATVHAGTVSFKHPGTVEITAYASGQYPKTVTLYSIISDGVYNLKNVSSQLYARMDGTDLFENNSSLSLSGEYDPSADERMMWRLHYHGEGKYSIRSYANPRRGIHVSNYEPSVTGNISSSDTLNNRGGAWYISSDSAGCILTNVNLKELSLANVLALPKNYSIHDTKLIYEDAAGTTSDCERRWILERVGSVPSGIYLYQYNYLSSGKLSSVNSFTASSITKDAGDQVRIGAIYRNPNNISQSFTWTSSNTDVATVENGTIIAKWTGTATITVKHSSGESKGIIIDVSKCAIIILPGIMGSQIFADENITISRRNENDFFGNTIKSGKRLWDPPADYLPEYFLVDESIWALEQDADGNPMHRTKIYSPLINDDSNKTTNGFQYGATDIYRKVNYRLNKEFNKAYDVVYYEYDWRNDPYDTALLLNKFITDSKYGKVVFVSHSMGGIVSSYYLSLGQSQRNKVIKHISVGTPYLGSIEIPEYFVSGNIRDKAFHNAVVSEAVIDIIGNIPSIYSLFPCEQHWKPYLSYFSYSLDKIYCTTYDQTMAVLSKYLATWNTSMANRVIDNTKKLFLSNGQHITTLVDSYYIVGTGEQTTSSILGILDNFISFDFEKDNQGDGTVTKYSATIGNSVESNRIYFVDATSGKLATHVGMIEGKDDKMVDESTIDLIISIIKM